MGWAKHLCPASIALHEKEAEDNPHYLWEV